jgi:AcrR family transcriptional regulator
LAANHLRCPGLRDAVEEHWLMAQQRVGGVDERRALRRDRLIAAAADVYGEVGYRNATVRMICRRARLTERYFYESFGTSEDLLIWTAQALAGQTLERMRRLRDGTDADRDVKTRRMLKGYFRSQLDEPSKARVFTLEFRGMSAAADAEFERILDSFADLIVDTRDPQGIGLAARDRLLRRGIVGGILQITVAWIESGYPESIEAVVATAARLCTLADPD